MGSLELNAQHFIPVSEMNSMSAEKDEWNLVLLCNLTSRAAPSMQRSTRNVAETFAQL